MARQGHIMITNRVEFSRQQIESLNKRMSMAKLEDDSNEYFRLGEIRVLYEKQLYKPMYSGIGKYFEQR